MIAKLKRKPGSTHRGHSPASPGKVVKAVKAVKAAKHDVLLKKSTRLAAAEAAGPNTTETEPEVSPLADPRVVGLLPTELLQPSELIILFIQPSPWFIVLTCLRSIAVFTLLLMAGLTAYNYGVTHGIGKSDIFLVYLGLVVARLLWQFFEWQSQVFVMTDQRMIKRSGFLRPTIVETPLHQITHTTTHFSLRERMFGLGSIGFATAGTDLVEAWWRMVANPLSVHQVVVQTLNRYGRFKGAA